MQKLLLLLLLISISSCAKQVIERNLSNSQLDSLKGESFLRYNKDRTLSLSDEMQTKHLSLLKCYQGDIEDGLKSIRDALKGKPASQQHWIETGLCHYLGGNFVQSSYFFGLLLAQSKNKYFQSLAHNNLGIIQMKMKRYDDSNYHFTQAIKISPAMITPQFNRIQLLLQFHHYDQALKRALSLSKQAGQDGDIILAKVIAYYYLGRPSNVLQEFKHIPLALKMRQDFAAYHAASLYDLKKFREAQKVLEDIDKPDNPEFKKMINELSNKVDIEVDKIERSES